MGALSMLLAPLFLGRLVDFFSPCFHLLDPAEVDISRRHVAQRLMISFMVVVGDKVADGALQFPMWQTVFLVGIALWGLAGASIATMAIGGLKVDFTSEDLGKRTSPATNYLSMGLNGIFACLTIFTSIWLIIHLYPDSRTVLAFNGLAGYSAFKWFFSDNVALLLGLLTCQIAFWAGTKLLWEAATRRLEGWEAV